MRRASGCLVGLAIGDALAAPTEFLTVAQIIARFPPSGPRELEGDPALVTDDTQMSLAVAAALARTGAADDPLAVEQALRATFMDWYVSPDNNRAPGVACLRACAGLQRGLPWVQATGAESKGCGANMRVAPVGLWAVRHRRPAAHCAALAQFQAALTHGHPTALAASDLTARAVVDLAQGGDAVGLLERLRAYAVDQRTTYHAAWLGELWQRPAVPSAAAFIARGWDECLASLDRLALALAAGDRETDPCLATGEGWVAEEALATGLLCFLLYPDDPLAAIRRAACTAGDSDSIASLAGAFAGAHWGLAAWPTAWIDRLEYRDQLLAYGAAWDD